MKLGSLVRMGQGVSDFSGSKLLQQIRATARRMVCGFIDIASEQAVGAVDGYSVIGRTLKFYLIW
jgi:hypothetical protein